MERIINTELPIGQNREDMDQRCVKQGDLHKLELKALELEIRKEILDFIGLELRRIQDIEVNLGINDDELNNHLSMLESAMLVEQEEGWYRLTPRCIAYLDECRGYEWRR
jgi:hypothetical protein